MPMYDFRCKACGKKFEDFKTIEKYQSTSVCPKCGETAVRDFSNCSIALAIFNPYVDEHITGSPVLIETKRQKNRLLKENGLVEV